VVKFIKFWIDCVRDSFSRARGIVELLLFVVFLCGRLLSANVVWEGGVVLFFTLFIVEVCFVAPYRYAQRIENKLNELAARPPPTEFKLAVLPGYRIRPDDPHSVFINLSLSNVSTPPAELHNIVGEFWTDQHFIRDAATQPRIHAKAGPAVFAYYDFSVPMLHKNTSIPITEWKFRMPSEGESIPIGIRVVSSETSWHAENWRVIPDGERVRITLAISKSD